MRTLTSRPVRVGAVTQPGLGFTRSPETMNGDSSCYGSMPQSVMFCIPVGCLVFDLSLFLVFFLFD